MASMAQEPREPQEASGRGGGGDGDTVLASHLAGLKFLEVLCRDGLAERFKAVFEVRGMGWS